MWPTWYGKNSKKRETRALALLQLLTHTGILFLLCLSHCLSFFTSKMGIIFLKVRKWLWKRQKCCGNGCRNLNSNVVPISEPSCLPFSSSSCLSVCLLRPWLRWWVGKGKMWRGRREGNKTSLLFLKIFKKLFKGQRRQLFPALPSTCEMLSLGTSCCLGLQRSELPIWACCLQPWET